jgi:hypothetical protein
VTRLSAYKENFQVGAISTTSYIVGLFWQSVLLPSVWILVAKRHGACPPVMDYWISHFYSSMQLSRVSLYRMRILQLDWQLEHYRARSTSSDDSETLYGGSIRGART